MQFLKIFGDVYVFQKFPRFFSVLYQVMEHTSRPVRDLIFIGMSWRNYNTQCLWFAEDKKARYLSLCPSKRCDKFIFNVEQCLEAKILTIFTAFFLIRVSLSFLYRSIFFCVSSTSILFARFQTKTETTILTRNALYTLLFASYVADVTRHNFC